MDVLYWFWSLVICCQTVPASTTLSFFSWTAYLVSSPHYSTYARVKLTNPWFKISLIFEFAQVASLTIDPGSQSNCFGFHLITGRCLRLAQTSTKWPAMLFRRDFRGQPVLCFCLNLIEVTYDHVPLSSMLHSNRYLWAVNSFLVRPQSWGPKSW